MTRSRSAWSDLVAVMDRLRSPGGCPWDAEQTHESLLRYAVEEVHEVVEAVESGDRDAMREELGDLLLQVVFHARLAQEHPDEPFDVEDVARGVVEKLVRRHPHVFGDAGAVEGADLHRQWDRIKREEKPARGALDGIPPSLPALARAQKVVSRLRRAGYPPPVADAVPDDADLGSRLLALVVEAEGRGVDAEGALRRTLRAVEADAREADPPGPIQDVD
ncbi:MazG family protein [Cellulomonas bogoriensis]